MATNDEMAEALRSLAASDSLPFGYLQMSKDEMVSLGEQVMAILSPNSQHYATIMGALGQVMGEVDNAIAALKNFETITHDAADAHQHG